METSVKYNLALICFVRLVQRAKASLDIEKSLAFYRVLKALKEIERDSGGYLLEASMVMQSLAIVPYRFKRRTVSLWKG